MNQQSGFSLLEALISIFLMSLAVSGFLIAESEASYALHQTRQLVSHKLDQIMTKELLWINHKD